MNEIELLKTLLDTDSDSERKEETSKTTNEGDIKKLFQLLEYISKNDEDDDNYDEDKLIELANNYSKKDTFNVGDKVKWKKGLKNKKRPKKDQIAVVVDILEKPVYGEEEKSSGSPYFKEPLDIRLGILDGDGDFTIYYFDSRRFEKVNK